MLKLPHTLTRCDIFMIGNIYWICRLPDQKIKDKFYVTQHGKIYNTLPYPDPINSNKFFFSNIKDKNS